MFYNFQSTECTTLLGLSLSPMMDVLSLCHNTRNASKNPTPNNTKHVQHLQINTHDDPLPESDCPGHGGIAVHDGVDPADKLIHTRDLAQVLLCELKDLVDVETDEIAPADQREERRKHTQR